LGRIRCRGFVHRFAVAALKLDGTSLPAAGSALFPDLDTHTLVAVFRDLK
jgi:hypothetical protein